VKIYGQDHALIAPILADLAIVLENQARFPEAETLQRQAIAIDTRALGNDHPETIVALNDLAFILETKGDLNRATETFRDAANRAKRALGSEHPTTIAIEVNFGRSLEFIGKLAEAEAVLDDTYRAAVKAHGPNDWQVGNILKTEAEVLAERRDVRDAADKFERAAAIFARTDGPTAYTVIGTRAELGSCLARQGRFADGEPLLLAYYHQAIERDKPEAAERLFGLYTVWGKKEKAAEYRRFIVEHFPSHLPHLAKYEDGKYLVTTPTASPSPR
jgi:tetratricopeptide (TPR) repeat protein